MNTNGLLVLIVLIILALGGIFWWYQSNEYTPPYTTGSQASSTDQSVSDGTITMPYSSSDFGLAVNKTQILVTSYIPPCDDTFNYCFYYNGTDYQGTNFDSAGLRVGKRADLSTERTCLQTPPAGFDASMTPTATSSADVYSMSKFDQVGQGAAGHISNDTLYRLYYRSTSTCYEFETRVAQSQFGNYPAGTIQQFTMADQSEMQSELMNMLSHFTIGGQPLRLPA